MSNKNEDLALILEGDTLELIRTQGIFLVFSVAIFQFTSRGKVFSLISLLISLTINITLVINYYIERSRIVKLGFYPKMVTEIIMILMIFVFFFTLWIMYEVWNSNPVVPLTELAEEIENKIDVANKANVAQLNENLKQIEENRKLVENLEGNEGNNISNKKEILRGISTNKVNLSKITAKNPAQNLVGQAGLIQLEESNRNKTMVSDASLAAVS
jgi:hypothetical protein